MDEILIELGLSEAIEIFKANKIGPEEVLLLTDQEFIALNIDSIGDRARLRSRCRNSLHGSPSDSPVVKRLKELQRNRCKNKSCSTKENNNNNRMKCKTSRRIYIGWKMASPNSETFTQVHASKGGGSRTLDIRKECTLKELEKEILDVFFPSGVCKIQNKYIKDTQKYYLANFTGEKIDGVLKNGKNFTIQNYLEEVLTHPVRIYLHTVFTAKVTPEASSEETSVVVCLSPVTPEASSEETSVVVCLPPFTHEASSEETSVDVCLPPIAFNPRAVQETIPETSMSPNHMILFDSEDELPDLHVDSGTPTIIFNHKTVHKFETLQEIIVRLNSQTDTEGQKNIINVTREDVLDGTKRAFLKKNFVLERLPHVRFSGEIGIDDGGPRREYMRLCLKEIKDSMIFQGSKTKYLIPDVKCEQNNLYFLFGKIIAYIVVHKGPDPSFFSEKLYEMIAYGPTVVDVSIDDVTDLETKEQILKIVNSLSNVAYQEAVQPLMQLIDFLGGVNLSINIISKHELANLLIEHIVKKRIEPHLQRGLETLGLLKEIRDNPALMRDIFVNRKKKLSALEVENLFDVTFAEVGSNNFRDELKSQAYWRDFLQDLDEDDKLSDLLIFVTGLDEIPLLGFDPSLKLCFNHTVDNTPYANTCANTLTIPCLEEYCQFKDMMYLALELGQTFTNV